MMYANVDGVSLDFRRGAYWLKLAALGNDAQALCVLGTSTKDCPGAERHKVEADRTGVPIWI